MDAASALAGPPPPPRGVAISGIIFAILYSLCLILLRLSIPADPAEPGDWLGDPRSRGWLRFSLHLAPFAGLSFLWFMGVLRDHIGRREDQFFATVFLGSGLLFVGTLFAAAAVAQGLLGTFGGGVPAAERLAAYALGRQIAYALMNTFAMRMAAVFMLVTSTIGMRTGVLSRGLCSVGLVLGLVLLLALADFAWLGLLLPLWVLLISVWILVVRFHRASGGSMGRKPAVA